MSALSKWSLLDHGKVAHWWLGREGTACGRDFKSDIRKSDDEADPLCPECADYVWQTGADQ